MTFDNNDDDDEINDKIISYEWHTVETALTVVAAVGWWLQSCICAGLTSKSAVQYRHCISRMQHVTAAWPAFAPSTAAAGAGGPLPGASRDCQFILWRRRFLRVARVDELQVGRVVGRTLGHHPRYLLTRRRAPPTACATNSGTGSAGGNHVICSAGSNMATRVHRHCRFHSPRLLDKSDGRKFTSRSLFSAVWLLNGRWTWRLEDSFLTSLIHGPHAPVFSSSRTNSNKVSKLYAVIDVAVARIDRRNIQQRTCSPVLFSPAQ